MIKVLAKFRFKLKNGKWGKIHTYRCDKCKKLLFNEDVYIEWDRVYASCPCGEYIDIGPTTHVKW
jgi:hypothetical protein